MLYGAPYEPRIYPDDARDWLTEKKKEIQSMIESGLETIGLDDEKQLNYEIDCCIKDLETLLKQLKAIDQSEIEDMENIIGWDPECP